MVADAAAQANRRAWIQAAVALLLALGLLCALYYEATVAAVAVWYSSPTFNHAFLIIPISLYVVWERRNLFASHVPTPTPWLALAIPLIGCVWLVADTASILEGQQIALVAMFQVAIAALIGLKAYRAFLFPCLYLFFLVPTGDYLVPPLQDFTAHFSVAALRLVGIPVFVDGIFISIPTGNFEVAEACAGLRFLIATIAFGFLFADLVYRSLVRRTIFILLCFVIPVIANGFRAFGIIIIAYLSSNELAVGVDHIVYGWVFFSFVMLLLIWIGLQFRDAPPEEATPPAIAPSGRTGIALAAAFVAVAVLAVLAPAYAGYLKNLATDEGHLAELQAPSVSEPWQQIEPSELWQPIYPKARRQIRQSYASPAGTVDLVVAYYPRQTEQAEIIAHDNRVADEDLWQIRGYGAATLQIEGKRVQASVTRLSAGRARRVVVRTFWVGSHLTSSTVQAKLLQAYGELISGDRAAAAILFSAEYDEDPDTALELINDFIQHSAPLTPILLRAE